MPLRPAEMAAHDEAEARALHAIEVVFAPPPRVAATGGSGARALPAWCRIPPRRP